MPFGELNTFYSSMIHLNDSTILIAAHETSPGEEMRALYLRKGRIKDYVTTSVTRLKSPFIRLLSLTEIFISEVSLEMKLYKYLK